MCMHQIRTITLLIGSMAGQLLPASISIAQAQQRIVMEKAGTFTTTSDNLIGHGPDIYGKECHYTKTEEQATKARLTQMISLFRETPVLTNPKGFDGIAHMNIGYCNTRFGYGLPCTMYFFFQTWFERNGKIYKHTIEPPQFRFEVNRMDVFRDNGFNVAIYADMEYSATNPAYNTVDMKKATLALRELFFSEGAKRTIQPGMDRYGNQVVLFNPDRPPYWEQVTIREVFSLLLNYWKRVPDKRASDAMTEVLNNEYAAFSEEQRSHFAYMGNPESISRIDDAVNLTPVLRCNPNYWNRQLPRSAIQFMVLEIPEESILKPQIETQLQQHNGSYFVSRLMYELDLNKLLLFIAK